MNISGKLVGWQETLAAEGLLFLLDLKRKREIIKIGVLLNPKLLHMTKYLFQFFKNFISNTSINDLAQDFPSF